MNYGSSDALVSWNNFMWSRWRRMLEEILCTYYFFQKKTRVQVSTRYWRRLFWIIRGSVKLGFMHLLAIISFHASYRGGWWFSLSVFSMVKTAFKSCFQHTKIYVTVFLLWQIQDELKFSQCGNWWMCANVYFWWWGDHSEKSSR